MLPGKKINKLKPEEELQPATTKQPVYNVALSVVFNQWAAYVTAHVLLVKPNVWKTFFFLLPQGLKILNCLWRNSTPAASANTVDINSTCSINNPVMVKSGCSPRGYKTGHVFVRANYREEECAYSPGDVDRMVTIIHPVPPENDGFIGNLSTSNTFGGDTVSERGRCACICVFRAGHGQWKIAIN